MAQTDLSNIIQPNIFAKAVTEAVVAKSALMSSGAVVRSNEMNELAAQPGMTGTLPIFGLQGWSAPEVATDNTTQATVNNIAMAPQYFQKDYLTKTWGAAELASTVSGEDIVGQIVNNVVAPYWVETFHQYALTKLSGVFKDNAANDAGDMIKNLANDSSTAVTAAELANFGNMVEALQTMGDARSKIALIIMPSRIFSNLMKAEPTSALAPSATVPFETYQGLPVILDDSLPVTVGTNRTTYTIYLLGKGSLAFGEAAPARGGVFVKDDGTAAKGWGLITLTTRKQVIIHPVGYSSSATVASNNGSPLLTAYDAASAWDRKVSRKNAPMIQLKVNG